MDNSLKLVFYNHFSGRQAFEMPAGSRPWHMLLLITEGAFSCRFGEQTFQIEKDEVAFFPQSLHFERAVISPISFHQFGFLATEELPIPLPSAGKLSLPRTHAHTLGEMLDASAALPPTAAKDASLCALCQLLWEHAVYEQSIGGASERRDRDVAYVIRYMTAHLAEPIRVEAIAEELHISRIGLLGKFKRQMGCTLSDFLIGLRMQRAKYLLLESNARINEIAASCGYNNAYYFSNAFKKQVGCAPLAYRRKKLGTATDAQSLASGGNPRALRSEADSI